MKITHKLSKREMLAEYAHDAWSGWMKYMFQKSKIQDDGTLIVPKWAVDRWKRQMNTSYIDMPESEKDSDLIEADRMLKIMSEEKLSGNERN
jgi:hypothetical protein